MDKVKIGITIGDINGIGPEVIIKTLADERVLNRCIPVIYGSSKSISYHKNIVKINDFSFSSQRDAERLNNHKVNVINCWSDQVNITLGEPTVDGGKYAYIALDRAMGDLKKGAIDALVTAPVNKEAMRMADFPYPGHTEYLAKQMDTKNYMMMMVSDTMKVALVTAHLPLKDVAAQITRENLEIKLKILIKSLKVDFGIEKPTIAVLGLNPHASDNGLIGKEEEELIRPIIISAKKSGDIVMGPYPADGFFGAGIYKKVDAVLAMYHDQGLIPFKALTFSKGVNYSAGLPLIRTSPDHGTAYNIAGKNEADPGSFRSALFQAIDIHRNRTTYQNDREDIIVKRPKPSEEV
jgi:4-hydroxythreonine-4-phosphate dehydrogenase